MQIGRVMLFREMIAIYSENHAKTDKYTLRAKCRFSFSRDKCVNVDGFGLVIEFDSLNNS
jgi:hypothetical protein